MVALWLSSDLPVYLYQLCIEFHNRNQTNPVTGCVGQVLMGTRVAFSVQVFRDGWDYVAVDKHTPAHTGTHTDKSLSLCFQTHVQTLEKKHTFNDRWDVGITPMSENQTKRLGVITPAYIHVTSRSDIACTSTNSHTHKQTKNYINAPKHMGTEVQRRGAGPRNTQQIETPPHLRQLHREYFGTLLCGWFFLTSSVSVNVFKIRIQHISLY